MSQHISPKVPLIAPLKLRPYGAIQICLLLLLLLWDLDIHLVHGSLDPCESVPNGNSIGSAVLAGLTVITNRQTDEPRYVPQLQQ